jgi:gliding motility-associated-like protein
VENIASGPSINDYFIPQEIPKTTIRQRINILNLQIFNRWGERIFFKEKPTSSPEELKWDGYLNGKLVPQESYVWVVEYEEIDFPKNGIQTQRGAVIVAY